jgi:predicted NBD/HSP70 family sugar kinase
MQANTNLAGIEIGGTKLQLCIARDTGIIVQLVEVWHPCK